MRLWNLMAKELRFADAELRAVTRSTAKCKIVDDASPDLARHHNYHSRMGTFQKVQRMHKGREADCFLYHEAILQSFEPQSLIALHRKCTKGRNQSIHIRYIARALCSQ